MAVSLALNEKKKLTCSAKRVPRSTGLRDTYMPHIITRQDLSTSQPIKGIKVTACTATDAHSVIACVGAGEC